jgi:hypothetical protein
LAQGGVDTRELRRVDEQARVSSRVEQGLVSQINGHAFHILL